MLPKQRRQSVVHAPLTLLSLLALFCALIASGAEAPANLRNPTELHQAISRGDRAAWKRLLQEGADVNVRNADGNTPLHLAALHNQVDAVRALLDRGADANATNTAMATPLSYGTGNLVIVRALLAHHANPNVVSTIGLTPLLSAVAHGDSFDVVQLLVGAGANIACHPKEPRRTDSRHRHQCGDPRTVAYLLRHGARVGQTNDGMSPLEMAAEWGDLHTVKALVSAGADVNYSFDLPGPALNGALWGEQREIAFYLLNHGADLHLPSNVGHRTPPMVWAGFGQFDDPTIAQQMISKGMDVNAANEAGETALYYALKAGPDTKLVKYLRSIGAEAPASASRKKAIPSRTRSRSR